jgi:hypothetical protein
MTPEFRIREDAPDWEADWEASRRFQIRYWAGLSLEQKLNALEEMCSYAREAEARWSRRRAKLASS